ncbi:MAG: S41 family peptidase, partial [Candidatus Methylomirabilales bacterium]
VRLITFSGGAGDRVREAVKQMSSRGARGFILDLRGNPGGLLEEAVNVAGVFLDGGRVVSYRERGRDEVHRDVRGAPETKLPLVVLVDEGSASASEIVAGAIQDRRRGILVGTATYGKGSVQTVFPLSGGSAVKLTTSSYFTPAGRAIGKGGIAPDVQADGKEVQLARALEILAELLAAGEAQAAA